MIPPADPATRGNPAAQWCRRWKVYLNLSWVLADCIPFFWQRVLFWIPGMRYDTNINNDYRREPWLSCSRDRTGRGWGWKWRGRSYTPLVMTLEFHKMPKIYWLYEDPIGSKEWHCSCQSVTSKSEWGKIRQPRWHCAFSEIRWFNVLYIFFVFDKLINCSRVDTRWQ